MLYEFQGFTFDLTKLILEHGGKPYLNIKYFLDISNYIPLSSNDFQGYLHYTFPIRQISSLNTGQVKTLSVLSEYVEQGGFVPNKPLTEKDCDILKLYIKAKDPTGFPPAPEGYNKVTAELACYIIPKRTDKIHSVLNSERNKATSSSYTSSSSSTTTTSSSNNLLTNSSTSNSVVPTTSDSSVATSSTPTVIPSQSNLLSGAFLNPPHFHIPVHNLLTNSNTNTTTSCSSNSPTASPLNTSKNNNFKAQPTSFNNYTATNYRFAQPLLHQSQFPTFNPNAFNDGSFSNSNTTNSLANNQLNNNILNNSSSNIANSSSSIISAVNNSNNSLPNNTSITNNTNNSQIANNNNLAYSQFLNTQFLNNFNLNFPNKTIFDIFNIANFPQNNPGSQSIPIPLPNDNNGYGGNSLYASNLSHATNNINNNNNSNNSYEPLKKKQKKS